MVRRIPAVLLLVVTAASCGSGDDPLVSLPGTSSTTTAGPGGQSEEPAAPGSPTSAPPRADPRSGTVTAPPPQEQPSPTAAPGKAWPDLDASGPPGSFAPSLLRGDRSARIEVRVSSVAGKEPRAQTLDHLAGVLRTVSGGKDVMVTGGGSIPAQEEWTSAELRQAAGSGGQGGGTAVIRLLFVGGRFADAEGVIGVSVRGDAAAVFSDEVERARSPLVGSAAIEDAVTMHEVGHLLGLVDLYLSTGRQDPEHPGHSRNRGSVMYWAVESTLVTDVLAGGPPRDFDGEDLDDLRRIREGA